MRVVAIMGGGDWADASVDHLNIPNGMDLEAENRKYREWLRERHPMIQYKNFSEWLIERGADEADVDEYWEI